MTALNIILQRDAAHLLTDGAGIDASGKLAYVGHKAAPLPHLGVAVAVNGTRLFLMMVVEAVSVGASSADDLHDRIVEILQETIIPAEPAMIKQYGRHALAGTVAVAAWSEFRGPHAYLVATYPGDASLPSWQRVDVPGMFYSPSDPHLNSDFADLDQTFDDIKGAELIGHQRNIIAPSLGNWTTPIVGAFAQRTSVRRDGIETRVIARWSDAIGETINPN